MIRPKPFGLAALCAFGLSSLVSFGQTPIKILSVGGICVIGTTNNGSPGPAYHVAMRSELITPSIVGDTAYAPTLMGNRSYNANVAYVSNTGVVSDAIDINGVHNSSYFEFRMSVRDLMTTYLGSFPSSPPTVPDYVILWTGETEIEYLPSSVGYDPKLNVEASTPLLMHRPPPFDPGEFYVHPLPKRIRNLANDFHQTYPSAQVIVISLTRNGVPASAANSPYSPSEKMEQTAWVNSQMKSTASGVGIPSLGSYARFFNMFGMLEFPADFDPSYSNGNGYPQGPLFPNATGYQKLGVALGQFIRAIDTNKPFINSDLYVHTRVGKPFSYAIESINSPTSYAASGLPSGFTINTSTGSIDCANVTAASATYNVLLTATNAQGSNQRTLFLHVGEAEATDAEGDGIICSLEDCFNTSPSVADHQVAFGPITQTSSGGNVTLSMIHQRKFPLPWWIKECGYQWTDNLANPTWHPSSYSGVNVVETRTAIAGDTETIEAKVTTSNPAIFFRVVTQE